jgi:putative ABC transport system ATP-binding protein
MNIPFFKKKENNSNGNGYVISMERIRKIYDTGKIKVEALRDISLKVKSGEFIAIVGPSGSGKSTLMNLLGCLDVPTEGIFELSGEKVSDMNREKLAEIRNRKIGFVFQNFNLLPQLTSLENIEIPMIFGKVPPSERKERARELLKKMNLEDKEVAKPTELSGGQMQRVAIARALAMNPDVVLADEPTGNLDTSSGSDIMSLFTELNSTGRTVIIVTHDLALARRASRIIEIRDGKIERDSNFS